MEGPRLSRPVKDSSSLVYGKTQIRLTGKRFDVLEPYFEKWSSRRYLKSQPPQYECGALPIAPLEQMVQVQEVESR